MRSMQNKKIKRLHSVRHVRELCPDWPHVEQIWCCIPRVCWRASPRRYRSFLGHPRGMRVRGALHGSSESV